MNDFVKKFFEKEFAEIEKNKFRISAMIFCASALIVFSVGNFGSDEEKIISSENQQGEENFSDTEKNSDAEKISVDKKNSVADNKKISEPEDKNFISVIGANSEQIFVGNPFQISEVEPEKISDSEEKISEPEQKNSAPVIIVQNPPPQKNSVPVEEEKFILSGTAITDNQKTALVQHYKGKNFAGTLFLKVGDSLKGKRITEITEDAIILSSGEKLYVN